jgi:hypothetical protein
MKALCIMFCAALVTGCSGTGKLPFSDDELEPGHDGGGSGSDRPGSGGAGSYGGSGGATPMPGSGGYSASGGSGGSASYPGSGGSGSSSSYDYCPTEAYFEPQVCDDCMRNSCCDYFSVCDDGTPCGAVHECAVVYGCYDGSYDPFTCVQSYCSGDPYAANQWSNYYGCYRNNCMYLCE